MSASSSPNPAVQGALLDACVRPRAGGPAATVEKAFSVPFVAELALKEKQIQQNVRPVIAVHKWFARRPGTLFRAILLSEFAAPPLPAAYFDPHRLHGVRVADPFMGGGTPLLEANRLGCDVFGWDVNPMAFWVVRQGIEHLDLAAYETTARRLGDVLEDELGPFYRTRCGDCGRDDASVKYFIWVKSTRCDACGTEIRLLPGYVLAYAGRHPRHVLICRHCGDLTELDDLDAPPACGRCDEALRVAGRSHDSRCRHPGVLRPALTIPARSRSRRRPSRGRRRRTCRPRNRPPRMCRFPWPRTWAGGVLPIMSKGSVTFYVLDALARRRFRERLQSRPRVEPSVSAADLVREGRNSR